MDGKGVTHQDSVLHFVSFDLQFNFLLNHQLDLAAHRIFYALWEDRTGELQIRKSIQSYQKQKWWCQTSFKNYLLVLSNI